ncbi:hypothetical protein [Sphingomicrobium nitratireducens]|uniref:hypothetical protein n=1 Tax=Sphingomicrobium nitratireducens TaxID=2964666 RepID=UPI00223FA71B|nr:hypothetical protein [Sphingomicrobium nitratireducens]
MDLIASYQAGLADEVANDARDLAGAPGDRLRRVATYFHLYQHSQGRFPLALVLAQLALWAPKSKLARGWEEGDAKLCASLLAGYRMTAMKALEGEAERRLDGTLREALERIHRVVDPGSVVRANGAIACWAASRRLAPALAEKRGDAATKSEWVGFSGLGWRSVKLEAPAGAGAIEAMLLEALSRGAAKGWAKAERAVIFHKAMPKDFAANPARHFFDLQQKLAEQRRRTERQRLDHEFGETVRLVA